MKENKLLYTFKIDYLCIGLDAITWDLYDRIYLPGKLLFNTVYEGVSNNSWHHTEVKVPHTSIWYWIHKTSLKSHYAKLHIPPILYWLSTDQICYMGAWYWNPQWDVFLRNGLLTIIHKICEHPRKCTLGRLYRNETNKFDFYTICLTRNHINYNENTFHKQNLTMNITAKHNLPFNAVDKNGLFWSNL